MRRTAIGLSLCLACIAGSPSAWAQPAQPPADDAPAAPPGDEPAAEPPTGDATPPGGAAAAPPAAFRPDYSDILAVPRRTVLKRRRVEVMPTYNVSINNPIVRHHGFGGVINFYLSEALFVGIEGTYYARQLTDRYFLLGVNERVLPSANHFRWSALLDFGYVPIYGKFTLFNSLIAHWDVSISAGVGVINTAVIPRDPAYPGFDGFRFAVLLPGVSSRLFLSKWLAFDVYLKGYIFPDKLEPNDRQASEAIDSVKNRAISLLTYDLVFGVGFSIFLPPGYEYRTPR